MWDSRLHCWYMYFKNCLHIIETRSTSQQGLSFNLPEFTWHYWDFIKSLHIQHTVQWNPSIMKSRASRKKCLILQVFVAIGVWSRHFTGSTVTLIRLNDTVVPRTSLDRGSFFSGFHHTLYDKNCIISFNLLWASAEN